MAANAATQDVLREIGRRMVVPVIAIEDAEGATPLGDALVEGGLPIAEITFRTEAAEASIRALAGRKDLLVGAGTVINPDLARRAVDAGAKFIVSPGFNPKTVRWCVDNGVPIVPGMATPSDLEAALDHGVNVVKFFPAEALGGIKTLRATAAPYGGVKFVPTGGVTADNMEQYLSFPAVLAVGGSWMVSKELLSGRSYAEVTKLARDAVARAQRVRPGAA